MTDAKRSAPRVLVSAGSYPDITDAMRIVESLLIDTARGLGGILIEDADTFAICDMPRQRIVLISGATVQAPDKAQLQNLMAADARAFQKTLAQTAVTTGAKWYFSRKSGELMRTALRAAVDEDILVIGCRRLNAVPGKVVLLKPDGALHGAMEQAAAAHAKRLSLDSIVLSVAAGAKTAPTNDTADHLHFETLRQGLDLLARANAQAVFLDVSQGPVCSPEDLSKLQAVARCPLIVFGASNAHRFLDHSFNTQPSNGPRP